MPIICLTATATRRVRDDIVATLGLDAKNLKLFSMTTSRPNLHYEVRFKSDEADHYDSFLRWLRGVHSRRAAAPRSIELSAAGKRISNVSGIIYTLYRRDCEALALRLSGDGIGARPFHAGLSNTVRDDNLAGWVENRVGYDVIVATTAFGMGIDKDNVGFVVHWQIPKSFEGYYQEAGRAGRDGKASACIMYYGREDRDRAVGMMQREIEKHAGSGGNSGRAGRRGSAPSPPMQGRADSLKALVVFCESTDRCRHKAIAQYFGETAEPACDFACDWHKDAEAVGRRKNEGLASEEWCSTQRESGEYAVDDYG